MHFSFLEEVQLLHGKKPTFVDVGGSDRFISEWVY